MALGVFAPSVIATGALPSNPKTAQVEATNDVLLSAKVVAKQTASNVDHFALSQHKLEIETNAIKQGIEDGKKMVQVIDDTRLGVGISPTHACHELQDKETKVIRTQLAKESSKAIQTNQALKYSRSPAKSAEERQARHLALYCDNTEALRGMCLLSPTSLAGGDSDYSIYGESNRLSPNEEEASFDFIDTLIPITSSEQAQCHTDVCLSLAKHEQRYMALANVATSIFASQMERKKLRDTPLRLSQVDLLEQNPDDIVGEFDGITAHPDSGVMGSSAYPDSHITAGVPSTIMDLGDIKAKPFEGFGARIDGYIKEASLAYGVDEKTLRGFVKMEGGWKGAVSPTGAVGVGQFTKLTWNGVANSKAGKALGMAKVTHRCLAKTIHGCPSDPRADERKNVMATAILMTMNTATLKKAGIAPTPENLYMAHNMGSAFVIAIYKTGKITADMVRNAGYNGAKKSMTVQEFMVWQKQRYLQHYADANSPAILAKVNQS